MLEARQQALPAAHLLSFLFRPLCWFDHIDQALLPFTRAYGKYDVYKQASGAAGPPTFRSGTVPQHCLAAVSMQLRSQPDHHPTLPRPLFPRGAASPPGISKAPRRRSVHGYRVGTRFPPIDLKQQSQAYKCSSSAVKLQLIRPGGSACPGRRVCRRQQMPLAAGPAGSRPCAATLYAAATVLNNPKRRDLAHKRLLPCTSQVCAGLQADTLFHTTRQPFGEPLHKQISPEHTL